MSDSETINNIKYQNENGDILLTNNNSKKLTTDTEYYFNLISNPAKTLKQESNNNSEEYKTIFSSLVEEGIYEFKEISLARTINSKKDNRKASKCELLIVSKPKILKKKIKVKINKKT